MSAEMDYPSTPRAWAIRTHATADTSVVAPATFQTLIPVTLNAVRVDRIRICQVKITTLPGVIHIFLVDASSNPRRHTSMEYVAKGLTTTSVPPPKEYKFDSLEVPAGWSMIVTNTVASSTDAAGFDVLAFGGQY